jgi:hypothetical protein
MRFSRCCHAWLMSVGLLCAQLWAAAPTQPVPLWPGAAPGDGAPKETERDLTKPGEGGEPSKAQRLLDKWLKK